MRTAQSLMNRSMTMAVPSAPTIKIGYMNGPPSWMNLTIELISHMIQPSQQFPH